MKKVYLYPGKWAYSNNAAQIDTILGSCVGVALYDSVLKSGALNHYLLPNLPPGEVPSTRYGDIAMKRILDEMIFNGSKKAHLSAKVFGGASFLSGVSFVGEIGNRNIEIAIQFLADHKIPIIEKSVGGRKGRRISFSTSTFDVCQRIQEDDKDSIDITGFGVVKGPKKVRVAIVDDSATVRTLFLKIFEKYGIEVVGTAANAYEARELIVRTKPDVITLDLEMPRMNGVVFLEKLMKYMPVPVVIVSSLGSQGEAAMRTLELGAIEFVHKPTQFDPAVLRQLGVLLVEKVKAAASKTVSKSVQDGRNETIQNHVPAPDQSFKSEVKVIVMGGNAGSARSLKAILERLPSDTPPVVIANGTIACFLDAYMFQLQRRVQVGLQIAQPDVVLKAGHVYFAPPDRQIRLMAAGLGIKLDIQAEEPAYGQLPSSTVLFESASEVLSSEVIAILLGGFGTDGVEGLKKVHGKGGITFAELPTELSFPFAPQQAIALGVVDRILRAEEIPDAIIQCRNQRVTAA